MKRYSRQAAKARWQLASVDGKLVWRTRKDVKKDSAIVYVDDGEVLWAGYS